MAGRQARGMTGANTPHSPVGRGGCDGFDSARVMDSTGNHSGLPNTTPALTSHVLVGIRPGSAPFLPGNVGFRLLAEETLIPENPP